MNCINYINENFKREFNFFGYLIFENVRVTKKKGKNDKQFAAESNAPGEN